MKEDEYAGLVSDEKGEIVVECQFKQVEVIEDGKKNSSARKRISLMMMGVRRVAQEGVALLRDPQPEGFFTQGLRAVQPGTNTLGLLPLLALTSALGTLVVSISYSLSWRGNLALESTFFLGLLLIFAPNMVRLLSAAPSRFERICLLCVVGICLYLVLFMVSPLHVTNYDEFLQWRTATDITNSGHLFSENPLLPVSPYYPGLEIVTNALSSLTGLSIFEAGITIIIMARLLMILSLFKTYEKLTKSSRMAGIATAIYMANPHFLIFDALYNYETLALPLAACMLYILVRFEAIDKYYHWGAVAAYLALMALTVTHHMTDYFFDGLLLVLAATSLFWTSARKSRVNLMMIALFGVTLALAYAFFLQKNPVTEYLSEYFGTTFIELKHIITGTSAARRLFVSGASLAPAWDELLMVASVGLVSFGIPFGLLILWHRHRQNALAVTFGIISFAYPISQMFRYTNFGSEITDRAAAFLFLPIAYVLTLFITQFWPTRKLQWRAISLLSCALSIVFLGGVLIEAGPSWSSLPGPYLVVADVRSIEPEGIQTASWAFAHLGPGNRIGTDRINQILMLSYGDQTIVTRGNDTNISTVFSSPRLDAREVAMLRQAHIRYLVVDLRLSTSLPFVGFYFEDNEPSAFRYTSPISREALTKFNALAQVSRVYDSGDIVIYDVGALTDEARS